MPLLRVDGVSLAYGHLPLLTHVDFQIERGERVCLVGRNGAGKSTFLHVLTGAVPPDEGDIWCHHALRVAHLEQEVPPDNDETIYEVVAAGLGDLGKLLTEYHQATQSAGAGKCQSLQRMAGLQERIDALAGWNIEQKVRMVLTRLGLSPDQCFARCSGGIRRQTMLARALVSEPDLLLLDEPTNHLDIAAINWLEHFLVDYRGALIFITHDRMFLRHLATRIIELDRGKLSSFSSDFDAYLSKKGRTAGNRDACGGEFRQEAGRRRSVDSPGHQGAAHAQ